MHIAVRLQRWTKLLLFRLRQKRIRYWVSALLILIITLTGSDIIYQYLRLDSLRAQYFQFLLDHGPHPPQPKFIGLVLIDDHEYWMGQPSGRVPLNRQYLANLLGAISAAGGDTIAVDIDMGLPNPDSMTIPDEYKAESCALIREIGSIAKKNKRVVLATPISVNSEGRYRRDSDIYQASGLCLAGAGEGPRQCDVKLTPDEYDRISCGYIALPYNMLEVPERIKTVDGHGLDSFSMALAKAEKPTLMALAKVATPTRVDAAPEKYASRRYLNFISDAKYRLYNWVWSPADLRRDGSALKVQHTIIVGANWHERAVGRGPMVDLHDTPAGAMAGAVLHANYAEALLDYRTVRGVPKWIISAIEAVVGICIAIAFAVVSGVFKKFALLFAAVSILAVLQWTLLHGFAVFFDAVFPAVGLGLHSRSSLDFLPHLYPIGRINAARAPIERRTDASGDLWRGYESASSTSVKGDRGLSLAPH
jgi:CHASE2 domain-containing sensor protein